MKQDCVCLTLTHFGICFMSKHTTHRQDLFCFRSSLFASFSRSTSTWMSPWTQPKWVFSGRGVNLMWGWIWSIGISLFRALHLTRTVTQNNLHRQMRVLCLCRTRATSSLHTPEKPYVQVASVAHRWLFDTTALRHGATARPDGISLPIRKRHADPVQGCSLSCSLQLRTAGLKPAMKDFVCSLFLGFTSLLA